MTRDLGFHRHHRGKGSISDDHDREDVQKYQTKQYFPILNSLDTRCPKYDGDDMEVEI